ncbi:MAG: zinc-ribbon domain-containing protein [Deltaproteobacteria bacterium]|nr:zinc-ribbon domain-containing protein [Deltaproteobacteria bacterium]MBW2140374.1 zinc-ribbon domain-containing protein [Deltaproteobacteria bacterium]MBW2322359.1 zinc-ribbon domain-containing protein [Deltaproteobacteria bacterium]
MIVECESCNTKFNVDEDRIKDEGSKVRCAMCRHIFMIYKEAWEEPTPLTESAPPSEVEEEASFQEEAEDVELGPDIDEEAAGVEFPPAKEGPSLDDELTAFEKDLGLDELEGEAEELEPPSDEDLELSAFRSDEEEELEPLEEEGEDLELPVEEELLEGVDEEAAEPPGDEEIDALRFPGEAGEFEEIEEGDDLGPGLTDEDDFDRDIAATVLQHDVLEGYDEEIIPFDEELEEEIETATALVAKPVKRSRAFLWVLIVLLALTVALAGTWYFTSEKPSRVETDILGNKNIILDQKKTKHFWRQNEKEGPILVITGLAENANPTPRSYIKLKGMLNDGKEKVLTQSIVYCGNLLTDDELRVLSMLEINRRLMRRTGEKGANLNIGPGKSVEFMIAFNNIPDNLTGYTVEVVSSQPASLSE